MASNEKGVAGDNLESTLQYAKKVFTDRLGGTPSVVAYAPGRVNLIGEHTDYNNGCVFPMALQRVTVIVGRPLSSGNDCRIITTASLEDNDAQNDVTFSLPPPPTDEEYQDKTSRIPLSSPRWTRYIKGVVALLSRGASGGVPPFEAVINSSVPLGGGVSSSASLELSVCLFVEELCRVVGVALPKFTNPERALLCQRAEHMYAHSPCGIMDQFVCMMAEKDKALFIDCQPNNDGTFTAEGVPLDLEKEGLVVMVTNTNVKHNVGGGEYEKRRDRCYAACDKLGVKTLRDVKNLEEIEKLKGSLSNPVPDGPTEYQCAVHVVSEILRTIEAKEVLKGGDFRQFGKLMNESHESLKNVYKVSCFELDCLVELARKDERVYGSRMTGAGFGGCTVTLLKKEAVTETQKRIQEGYVNGKGERMNATFFLATPSSGAGIIRNI